MSDVHWQHQAQTLAGAGEGLSRVKGGVPKACSSPQLAHLGWGTVARECQPAKQLLGALQSSWVCGLSRLPCSCLLVHWPLGG